MLSEDRAVEVVGECRNAREAIKAVRTLDPDVVFLDVEMPGGNGFTVIETIGVERMPATVFVTAYDHHAIRAFEVLAADYLLKPFDEERLQGTLSRVSNRLHHASARINGELLRLLEALDGVRRYADRLAVEVGDHVAFVRTAEIDWIEAQGKHSLIHIRATTHVVRDGLTNLAARLDPAEFLRVHRSSVVRIDRVEEVHRWFRGDYHLILVDGTRLTTGATYRRVVQQVLLGA